MAQDIPPSDDSARRDVRYEKEEKEEKGRAEAHEKEEKGPSDRLSSAAWAIVLIFAGFVFLGVTTRAIAWLDWGNAWGLILMGAGVITGLEVAVRLVMPEYRRPISGQIVLAAVLFLVGVSSFTGWENVWPIFIIGIGVSVLLGALTRR